MQVTATKPFQFKQFSIEQDRCTMKVGTDGVLLGAWSDVDGASHILDVGTGTGVIAIMLAQRTENATIHAVEIDEEAYTQASQNMQNTAWANRLQAFQVAIQDFAKNKDAAYDLIVSNPPFFSGGTFSSSQDKTSVRHTVKLPHGDLLLATRKLLKEKGKFCVILPYLEGLRFKELANSYNLYCTKMTEVKPRADKPVERLLLQFDRVVKPMEKDVLVIQQGQANSWTAEYKQLTGEFYLKM
ncbi:MAG: tRNA1(Val) (adenine(37)-N6)-methyltransferase [Lewinellaceae bacterium]|nr:tRNA1(Val) (adenine(37)-N6)-methyltransferase [Saprospiraceae bacterium]MCB9339085.1 tRNA1(Val) (adenine(37)-N6)-methyltransferase [Lewinellaceae bacterium]